MDKKGSLEIGLKLERTERLMFFSFERGYKTAWLKAAGTHPEMRDVLTSIKMLGPTVLKASSNERGGMGVGRTQLTGK